MEAPDTVTEEMILSLIEKKQALKVCLSQFFFFALTKSPQRKLDETSLPAAAAAFSRESILITNQSLPDQPIVYMNHSFTTFTQYQKADGYGGVLASGRCVMLSRVGRNCRFLQGPDTDRSQVAAMRTAIRDRQSVEVPASRISPILRLKRMVG